MSSDTDLGLQVLHQNLSMGLVAAGQSELGPSTPTIDLWENSSFALNTTFESGSVPMNLTVDEYLKIVLGPKKVKDIASCNDDKSKKLASAYQSFA